MSVSLLLSPALAALDTPACQQDTPPAQMALAQQTRATAIAPVSAKPDPARHRQQCSQISTEQRLLISTAPVTTELAQTLSRHLSTLTRSAALQALDDFLLQPGLSAAQKEAALVQFVSRQRQQAASPMMRDVLQRLSNHTALVTMADPDHPGQQQAAFPVARSASGVLYQWDHLALCAELEPMPAAQLLDWWQRADALQQQAVWVAVDSGDFSLWQAGGLLAMLAERHADSATPTATAALAMLAAMHTGDAQTMLKQISAVAPALAISVLRRYSASSFRELYLAAAQHPDNVVATLAADGLRAWSVQARDANFDAAALLHMLGDGERGAPLAMRLAQSLSDEQIRQLQATVQAEQQLAQARLQTILDLRAELP
ncbi:MAG: hypothetical protein KKC01_11910 [Gammaproteobacteria bacterium]|nr:hypothetical protein [Gammaproteobacteria bacterium]